MNAETGVAIHASETRHPERSRVKMHQGYHIKLEGTGPIALPGKVNLVSILSKSTTANGSAFRIPSGPVQLGTGALLEK